MPIAERRQHSSCASAARSRRPERGRAAIALASPPVPAFALMLLGATMVPSIAEEPKTPTADMLKNGITLSEPGTPGRYAFHPVEGGILRLDRESGAVSLCVSQAGKATCTLAADDKAALEAEIARLTEANRQLLARAIPLPPDASAAPPSGKDKRPALTLPSDQEIDTALDFLEQTMRRFKDRMDRMADPQPAPPAPQKRT